MEKVCVYKNTTDIRNSINWCETVAGKLQELADLFVDADIVPTIGKLQSLYNGSSLIDLVNESCMNQGAGRMPKRVQELIHEDSAEKVNIIKKKAVEMINTDTAPIEWELYLVNNGKVTIKPEYKQIITDRHCIYIDSENRSAVYEKWLAMEKAIKDFNLAVTNSVKENSYYEAICKVNPNISTVKDANLLKGITPSFSEFSVASMEPDGTPFLKGANFRYIK